MPARLLRALKFGCMQVINHTDFQADPIAAVMHHLNATLPPAPPPPRPAVDCVRQKNQTLRRRREKALEAKSARRNEGEGQIRMAVG